MVLLEPWSDLAKLPDLASTLREGKRKAFMTRAGWAEPLFCPSCGAEIGYVAVGTAATQLCMTCLESHGGLPLPEPPNVSIRCSGKACTALGSIPRGLAGQVIYFCDPCEKRMGMRPPLQMMSEQEEMLLGVKRTA
jgi:hypothetical protein